MKVKKVKSNKTAVKLNWAEDDLSDTANKKVTTPVKKKKKTVESVEKISKVAKVEKIKNKAKKQSNEGSDDESHGASLDKLKEIDPEFYKVTRKNNKISKVY